MNDGADQPDEYRSLLEANREWVEDVSRKDPQLFQKLARGQSPPFLLVACCDSREAIDVATKAEPGQLFIHRNVANQVRLDDPAMDATVEFALGVLPIRHLVVSGHTRCGGVEAALRGEGGPAISRWIRPIRELADLHRTELDALPDFASRSVRLAELNVTAQLENLLRHPSVRSRVKEGRFLAPHGWIFEVESGVLREVDLPLGRWAEEGLVEEGGA